MNLCDPRTIRDVMSMYGMTFRKELGQNFLTNAAVVEDIADACSATLRFWRSVPASAC